MLLLPRSILLTRNPLKVSSILRASNRYLDSSFDCKNCSKKIAQPQCNACHRMVNYFNIFNIPQTYKVNSQTIAHKAKQLQKQYHPDKHSFNQQMQAIFKENLQKYSAYINEAKATLLDDLRRAVYMMEIKGVKIEEETKVQDSEFMMDMFQLQEEIEDGGREKCEEVKDRIEKIMREIRREFDAFFQAEDMQKCTEFVQKYKYLHRAYQNVCQKLDHLKEQESQR